MRRSRSSALQARLTRFGITLHHGRGTRYGYAFWQLGWPDLRVGRVWTIRVATLGRVEALVDQLEGPATSPPTNHERADFARRTLEYFAVLSGATDEPDDALMTDLLANLMHLHDERFVTEALRIARGHHAVEYAAENPIPPEPDDEMPSREITS